MVGGDGAVSQKCQSRHDCSLHLHAALIVFPGKQVFSNLFGHLTLQRVLFWRFDRLQADLNMRLISFLCGLPLPVGGMVGVLYGLCSRRTQWGGSSPILGNKNCWCHRHNENRKLVYDTPILLGWCSNGTHWVPIINVPLGNQRALMWSHESQTIGQHRGHFHLLKLLQLYICDWEGALLHAGMMGMSDSHSQGCEAQPVGMSTRMLCGRASGEALLLGTDAHLSIKGFCRPHRSDRLRCKPCVISVIFMLPLKVTRCAHIWMPGLLFISFHSLNIELSTRMFWGLAVVLHLLCVLPG